MATLATRKIHFQHPDYLGTVRYVTGDTGAGESAFRSAPFGESYSFMGNDDDRTHFAGLERDDVSATDHAQFRQYASLLGRWHSPDPYSGSYDGSNPQSFNRYSYALNSPLSYVDPLGLCDENDENLKVHPADCGGDGGGGGVGDPVPVSDPAPPESTDCSSIYVSCVSSGSPDCVLCIVTYPIGGTGGGVTGGAGGGVTGGAGGGSSSAPSKPNPLLPTKVGVCAVVAGGKLFQSFFGLPAGLQNGPPGTSTVLRAVRSGVQVGAPTIGYAAFKVGGAVAARFAEDAIPVVGEVLLAAQATVAAYDAVKTYHQCSAQMPDHY